MLSLTDLGISTAISFSLYKPLADNDKESISTLMSFYRKAYTCIGLLIGFLGIALIPFLKYIIKDIDTINDVYIIYVIYLINTVSTYLITYKETLIIADQKKYKIAGIEIIGIIILNCLQILTLMIYKNFIIYLLIQFIVLLFQRIVTNMYISNYYNDVEFNSKKSLLPDDKKSIVKNVKAMFYHKIGEYCINGTDNLIISAFISIDMVAIYSNFLMIINLFNNFITMIYNGITASLGNLIVTESNEKKEEIFNIMNFLAFVIYGGCSVCLVNVFNVFMELWIGPQYCLDMLLVVLIVVNFYLAGMRAPSSIMKSAAGEFDVDKYTPLIQSVINLVVSIALVKKVGLLGVLMGTFISSVALPSWQRPMIVYKYILQKSSLRYFIEYFKYAFITVGAGMIAYFINSSFKLNYLLFDFLIKGVISAFVFITLFLIIYIKSDEMKYLYKLVKRKSML